MAKNVRKLNRGQADPATDPELRTVSSDALLVNGSDAHYRRLIHNLMAIGNEVDVLRGGFARLIGVSPPQHELLMLIYRANDGAGISVGELASLVKLTSAFVATETNKLSSAGFVEKAPDSADRRRIILRVTTFGCRKLAFLSHYQRQVNDVLFGGFDRDAFLAFSHYLEVLRPSSERAGDLVTFLAREYERQNQPAQTSAPPRKIVKSAARLSKP
jgi:DNA-binding MarR family transcriptional regulator